jgi:hypothetical protein
VDYVFFSQVARIAALVRSVWLLFLHLTAGRVVARGEEQQEEMKWLLAQSKWTESERLLMSG